MRLMDELLYAQLRDAGLPEPVREYRFWPGRKWRFDFCWPECRIALELEGGVWTRGRHVRATGYELDCIKYSHAAIDGWCVLRATPAMLLDGRAIELVKMALGTRGLMPEPVAEPTPTLGHEKFFTL